MRGSGLKGRRAGVRGRDGLLQTVHHIDVNSRKDSFVSNNTTDLEIGILKLVKAKKDEQMVLPGGRNHYDCTGVDQVCVKQGPPPTAVQVGSFNHIRSRVNPEHQPAFDIHCQTFWTDEICRSEKNGDPDIIEEILKSFKAFHNNHYRNKHHTTVKAYLC